MLAQKNISLTHTVSKLNLEVAFSVPARMLSNDECVYFYSQRAPQSPEKGSAAETKSRN